MENGDENQVTVKREREEKNATFKKKSVYNFMGKSRFNTHTKYKSIFEINIFKKTYI